MSTHVPESVRKIRARIQSEDGTVRDAVTDTELVQAAVALHPEYGGASAVARFIGHDRSAVTRAMNGAGIGLEPAPRAQLILHLIDPEKHPFPPKGPERRGRPRKQQKPEPRPRTRRASTSGRSTPKKPRARA